jgi:hypothetical protein
MTGAEVRNGHADGGQSSLRELPPVQDAQGDAELDQIQVQDWDEKAKEDEVTTEEEGLARVQQEIERLRKEQETIIRRKAIAQHAKAHKQHINREWTRLTEL